MPKSTSYLGSIVARAAKPSFAHPVAHTLQRPAAPMPSKFTDVESTAPAAPRVVIDAIPKEQSAVRTNDAVVQAEMGPGTAHPKPAAPIEGVRAAAPLLSRIGQAFQEGTSPIHFPAPTVHAENVRAATPHLYHAGEAPQRVSPQKFAQLHSPQKPATKPSTPHEASRQVAAARGSTEEMAESAPQAVASSLPSPPAISPRAENIRLQVRLPEDLPAQVQAHRAAIERETVRQVRRQLQQRAASSQAAPLPVTGEIRIEKIEVKVVQPPVMSPPNRPEPVKASTGGNQGFATYFLQRTISGY